jgi:hypothetical protein
MAEAASYRWPQAADPYENEPVNNAGPQLGQRLTAQDHQVMSRGPDPLAKLPSVDHSAFIQRQRRIP